MSSGGVQGTLAGVPGSLYLPAAREVRYHSVALLTALIWNALLTFGDEVQYIWPMRHKKPFKWVYIFLRYGVIMAQAVHNILIEPLSDGINPPTLCRAWSIYVVGFSQILETLLEFILASRIYALWNQSRKIALILIILMLTEVGVAARTLWLLPLTGIHGTCLLTLAPIGVKAESITESIVHATFIGLTLFKYFAIRAGYGRSPLVSLVVRDGTTVYGVIVSIIISIAIVCGLDNERSVHGADCRI